MPPPRSILLATDRFDHHFHLGVARFAHEHDWRLSLESAYGRALPQDWRGDGVVAIVESKETAGFVASLKIPTVDAAQAWSGKLRLPRVHADDAAIGRAGAQFFLERGFRHLAFCAPADNPSHRARRDGFRQAAKAAGARFVELLPRDQASGDSVARQLRALGHPTGLCCADDCTAALLCEIAREENVEIPSQVAILGAGNLEAACEYARVPLSSIRFDAEHHGYETARLLEEILAGQHGPWPLKSPPVRLLAPGAVLERASTHGVAAQDERLARVVRHMHAHPGDDASVVALAGLARVGQRKLYELFAQEFNTTPAAFFDRVRLGIACRLLADPGRKLRAVAKEAGFGTALRMHRAFVRQVGVPPGAWRKLHAAGKAPQVTAWPQRQ